MPKTRLSIALATIGAPFNGDSPERGALGGSETALVQMARALHDHGCEVTVFCPCPAPGDYDNITYHHYKEFPTAALEGSFDVVVVSRHLALLKNPIRAGLVVLWNHDILARAAADLRQVMPGLDICLVLSRFHAADFLRRVPEIRPKLHITRNGLDLNLLARAAAGVKRVEGRLTYVSRPERGLRLLLEEIWPRLQAARPGLELLLCGYQISGHDIPAPVSAEYRRVDAALAASHGVRHLGSLDKATYYSHLASCQAMVYPCTFPEISCIAALEAQALSTPIITSDAYALTETVRPRNWLVPGRPGSPEYVEAFVKQSLEVIDSDQSGNREHARRAVTAENTWERIAAEWIELFEGKLAARAKGQARPLAASLVLSGDRMAAMDLLGRELPAPREENTPADPDETGLMDALAGMLAPKLPDGATLAVAADDAGRTLSALARLLPGRRVLALEPGEDGPPEFDAILLRDLLERQSDPAAALARLLGRCRPDGLLALCIATGAWPLMAPGHAGRLHDLGRAELARLLPGRELNVRYLPLAVLRMDTGSYPVGRLLALAPAEGPPPLPLRPGSRLGRVRPAPRRLMEEVQRVGLL